MPSLVDIAKVVEKTTIRGIEVEVPGASAMALAQLFIRFMELRKFFGGRAQDVNVQRIMQLAPELLGAFIAAGLGKVGDKEEEAAAQTLTAGEQVPLLDIIWKVTFPRGYQDFLDALGRVVEHVPAASGWEQATTLAGQSNDASNSATHQPTPGATLPESSPAGSTSTNETATDTKVSS